MLPLFRHHYSPHLQPSLNEGMIPTKNSLGYKSGYRTTLDLHSVLSPILWRTHRSPTRTYVVHGLFLQLCPLFHLLKNELGFLAEGTVMPFLKYYPRQEADRTCPIQIQVLGRSVCHHLEGPQAHPLPKESRHSLQACGAEAWRVECVTACRTGKRAPCMNVLYKCSVPALIFPLVAGAWEPWTRITRLHA